MGAPFSKGQIVRESWALTKAHFGFLFLALVLYIAVQIPFSIVSGILEVTMRESAHAKAVAAFAKGLLSLGASAVGLFVYLGQAKATLRIVRGEKPGWGVFGEVLPVYLPAVGAYFLLGMGIVAGLVLLVIPGVILLLGWSQFLFATVDGHAGPVAALKRSWALTKGAKVQLLLLFLLMGGINILGALALLVGLLFTAPMTLIMSAKAYEALRLRAEAASAPAA